MCGMIVNFYSVSDAYGEFSNFAPYPLQLDGERWPTSEHFFHAQKFEDGASRQSIRQTNSPMQAARLERDAAKHEAAPRLGVGKGRHHAKSCHGEVHSA